MVILEIWGCLGQVCSGFGGPEVSICFRLQCPFMDIVPGGSGVLGS